MKNIVSKDDIDRMVETAKEYKRLYDEYGELVSLDPWVAGLDKGAGVYLLSEETVRRLAHELEAGVEQNGRFLGFKYKDVYVYCVREVESDGN